MSKKPRRKKPKAYTVTLNVQAYKGPDMSWLPSRHDKSTPVDTAAANVGAKLAR